MKGDSKMAGNHWLIVFVAVSTGFLIAHDAKCAEAPHSRQDLQKKATHIVVARIQGIYRKKEKIKDDDGFAWERTHSVAEISVDKVEKGEGIDKLKPLYVKFWSQRATGFFRAPGLTGQWEHMKEGQEVRVYLVLQASDGYEIQTDNAFHVIGPNGFEKIKNDRGEENVKPQDK